MLRKNVLITENRKNILLVIFILGLLSLGCGFVEPVRRQIAGLGSDTATPTVYRTPRPTFTPTPNWTDTPTVTLTPTPTPTVTPTYTPSPTTVPSETTVPSSTPTSPPTETFTPAPPTQTFTPRPPTATFTPAPPTATPTPSYPYKVAEGPVGFPSSNPILVMYIALTDGNNVPVGGLKIVGDHAPSGRHIVSNESCFDFCKTNGLEGTIKYGNVTFEPPAYETGVWNLYVVDGAGNQVSDVVPVTVDFNNLQWFFLILRR